MSIRASQIAVTGLALRVPGAKDPESFWTLLDDGVCSVTRVSPERFPQERYFHPSRNAPGKTHTFAAGQIDDVWGFDPGFFGISPREAVQIDPQQRLLLQVVFEALEQGGIKASSLAGSGAGVFVGASALDYHHRFVLDPAAGDMQLMTGNTLSIVSNRISYIYDLRGPSFTVDTACSSSIVALHEAVNALESRQIDTAIVAGVNLLLSPFSFMGFARASMLSTQGLCRAFDADGDGYVRSEGAVAIILQREETARAEGRHIQARIKATGINADGRTAGLSLPSAEAQAALLTEIYDGLAIDPNDLAFVEAHGTGTRVGDPAEAHALGTVIGRKRSTPLTIGSVKTNLGHLEPASGLVGMVKAMLALKHDRLPKSLHFDTPNPDIDFTGLNLTVAGEPVALRRNGKLRLAGINSFGFGGTNAHVVIADGDPVEAPVSSVADDAPLILSAKSKGALTDLARAYRDRLAALSDDAPLGPILDAAAHSRDRLDMRLVALGTDRAAKIEALDAFLADRKSDQVFAGQALQPVQKLAFAFSGNGSQWAGMGCEAYQRDADFRAAFEMVDKKFMRVAGWSLLTMLFSKDLEAELERTEIAQPLLFALQVALVSALKAKGVTPQAVIGHSVGEVAAAWAAGALDLDAAVRVIHARSTQQEVTRHLGSMAALLLPADQAREAIEHPDFPGLELAAVNSPRSVTISGPSESLDGFAKYARKKRWALRKLNLAYPFHCALVDPIEEPLMEALSGLTCQAPALPFISTVEPEAENPVLDAAYWWRNVRQPVLFAEAMTRLIESGVGVVVEIGPRPVLTTYINDLLREGGQKAAVLHSFDQTEHGNDATNPVTAVAAAILANGGPVDLDVLVGPAGQNLPALPSYPWQNQPFCAEPTDERVDAIFGVAWPLAGGRLQPMASEWVNHVDPVALPFLADHKVEESIVFPAAGFAEMALRAVLEWTGADDVELRDFEILRPLVFDGGETFETMVRISPDDRVVEVSSRPRLQGADWSLNAYGRFVSISRRRSEPRLPAGGDAPIALDHDALYALTRTFGLEYGSAFRRVEAVRRIDERTAVATLQDRPKATADLAFSMCPTLLDAGFHGLFALLGSTTDAPEHTSFLPVRLGSLALLQPGADPSEVRIHVTKASQRSIEASFEFLDGEGAVTARIAKARFKAVQLGRSADSDDLAYRVLSRLLPERSRNGEAVTPADAIALARRLGTVGDQEIEADDALILLEALGRAIAHDTLYRLAENGDLSVAAMIEAGKLHASARPLVQSLLYWLADSGLAEQGDDGWTIAEPDGPTAAELLRTVVLEAGAHVAEAALLARLATGLGGLLVEGLPERAQGWFATGLFDAYLTAAPGIRAAAESLRAVVAGLVDGWPKDRPLDLLLVGAQNTELIGALDALLDPRVASLTVTDPSSAQVVRAARQWSGGSSVRFFEFEDENIGATPYDVIVSAGSLADLTDDQLAALRKLGRAGGLLLAVERAPSPTVDLIRGVGQDWWQQASEFPISRLKSAAEWKSGLDGAGFLDLETAPLATGTVEATLIAGRVAATAATAPSAEHLAEEKDEEAMLVVSGLDSESRKVAEALRSTLHERGFSVAIAVPGEATKEIEPGLWSLDIGGDVDAARALLASARAGIVHIAGAYAKVDDALAAVDDRLWSLAQLLKTIGGDPARLWIVAPGGAQDLAGGSCHAPAQAAVWAFGRVAMNEYPNADVRLIDLSPTLEPGVAAARLADEIAVPCDEREVILDSGTRKGLRIVRGGVLPEATLAPGAAPAMRLEIKRQGSLDQLAWLPVARRAPEGKEIEIAVEASGLNFRDVMWALGLLPEEALEDGFAGATLGMECCGCVTAVGPEASRFKVGDRVITFAPACFASHVTVAEAACAPMPATVSSEEAATIPVTFLTAYYALVQLAGLREDETVLIHGGAGGVGLAALQIAKWRGATVIATAGSEEKRSFLTLLGADHVLDSRSLAFVDDVLDLTDGDGVDVVLNSLFGEAMERSIEVLKPFGRFLELGKRDYYANTHIGLRPFRQNLTYFGIDADQLLTRQPELAKTMFAELVALFEDGVLTPLPYRAFNADGVVEAFRLMQQAGHIGKIVLRPPAVPADLPTAQELALEADATYLVAGGFGGFGMELLKRLAAHGARNLLVLSRRGAEAEGAAELIQSFAADGIRLEAEACDITDEAAVSAALDRARASMPPIRGVFHTAMVLNDVLIGNLDHDGLTRVLAPKIRGAELLDRLTAGDPLDHFVLYSSATTLVGNPGQANYVAANGFLEALARKRRAEGKPGLAVAWGAISDAGYLARNTEVNELLARKLGRHALTAKEALDGLTRLMAMPQDGLETAAVGFARIDWQAARRDLALLGTPITAMLGLGDADDAAAGDGAIDLAALLAGLDKPKATAKVAQLLAAEIGRILRISPDEIDPQRPLSDIGMDSLMALELRMNAERQLGIDIPLMSLANGATLYDMSARIAGRVLGDDAGSTISAETQALAGHHIDDDMSEHGDLTDVAAQVVAKSGEVRSLL